MRIGDGKGAHRKALFQFALLLAAFWASNAPDRAFCQFYRHGAAFSLGPAVTQKRLQPAASRVKRHRLGLGLAALYRAGTAVTKQTMGEYFGALAGGLTPKREFPIRGYAGF